MMRRVLSLSQGYIRLSKKLFQHGQRLALHQWHIVKEHIYNIYKRVAEYMRGLLAQSKAKALQLYLLTKHILWETIPLRIQQYRVLITKKYYLFQLRAGQFIFNYQKKLMWALIGGLIGSLAGLSFFFWPELVIGWHVVFLFFKGGNASDTASALVTLSGASLGLLGIVFALYTFFLQTVKDQQATEIIKDFIHGRVGFGKTYALIALFPLIFLIMSFCANEHNASILKILGFLLLAGLLAYLFHLYKKISLFLSPAAQAHMIFEDVRKHSKAMKKHINLCWKSGLFEDATISQITTALKSAFPEHFKYASHWITQLQGYSRSYLERHDYATGENILKYIPNVLRLYFDVSAGSFFGHNLLFDNPLSTDSTLNNMLENFKQSARYFVSQKDEEATLLHIKYMHEIALLCTTLKYANEQERDRFQTSLVLAYLTDIAISGVQAGMPDVGMDAIRKLRLVAIALIRSKAASHNVSGVTSDVEKIGIAAIADLKNMKGIHGELSSYYQFIIINYLLFGADNHSGIFAECLNGSLKFTKAVYPLQRNDMSIGDSGAMALAFSVESPVALREAIRHAFSMSRNETISERERNFRLIMVQSFLEEYRRYYHKLITEVIEPTDAPRLRSISLQITEICLQLVGEVSEDSLALEWKTEFEDQIDTWLGLYTFIHSRTGSDMFFQVDEDFVRLGHAFKIGNHPILLSKLYKHLKYILTCYPKDANHKWGVSYVLKALVAVGLAIGEENYGFWQRLNADRDIQTLKNTYPFHWEAALESILSIERNSSPFGLGPEEYIQSQVPRAYFEGFKTLVSETLAEFRLTLPTTPPPWGTITRP